MEPTAKWALIIHVSLFLQTLSSHAQGWKQGIQKSSLWRLPDGWGFVHKATLTNQNQNEYYETNINKKVSLACVTAYRSAGIHCQKNWDVAILAYQMLPLIRFFHAYPECL